MYDLFFCHLYYYYYWKTCYAKNDGPRLLLLGYWSTKDAIGRKKNKTTCITYTYNVQTDTYAGGFYGWKLIMGGVFFFFSFFWSSFSFNRVIFVGLGSCLIDTLYTVLLSPYKPLAGTLNVHSPCILRTWWRILFLFMLLLGMQYHVRQPNLNSKDQKKERRMTKTQVVWPPIRGLV
ncbi:hypothetical protein V8C42DRAFT_214935 [Trichoderma barbatum]